MLRKAFLAALAIASLGATPAAVAQDGGIWASRPHPRRIPQERVPANALPGLAQGLTVQTSDGKAIGRISQVVTSSDGSIRKVIVMSPVGNLIKLSPASLTISNGVVITEASSGR